MKKNFKWMYAAILTSGLFITSCDKTDSPVYFDPFERTTNVIDFEDGQTVFAATSRMSVEIQANDAKGSNVLAFKNAGNAQNGYGFAYYDFSDQVEKAAVVTFKFSYYNNNGGRDQLTIGDALVRGTNGAGAGFGRNTYGAKGAIFRIGSDKNNYFVNDVVLGGVADWCNKWLDVEVKVYNFDRKVEWKVKSDGQVLAQSGTTEGEGDDAVFTAGQVDFWQADANEATQIDAFGFVNNSTSLLDDLSIEAAVDTRVTFADYTVRYVNEAGEELKESVTRNGREGTFPILLDADKASFYNADNTAKFIYKEDNSETTAIAQGAQINVVFRNAETYNVVLNIYADGTTTRLVPVIRGSQFEGDNVVLYPAVCYKGEDGYYTVAPDSYNGKSYTFTGTETAQGGYIFGTLYYTKDESIVYYAECEDLETEGELGVPFSDKTFARLSQATGILPLTDSKIITGVVPAGTYTVQLYGRNDGTASADNAVLYIINADGTLTKAGDPDTAEWGSATMGWLSFANVTIPEGAKLAIVGTTGTVQFDCIKVIIPTEAAE